MFRPLTNAYISLSLSRSPDGSSITHHRLPTAGYRNPPLHQCPISRSWRKIGGRNFFFKLNHLSEKKVGENEWIYRVIDFCLLAVRLLQRVGQEIILVRRRELVVGDTLSLASGLSASVENGLNDELVTVRYVAEAFSRLM